MDSTDGVCQKCDGGYCSACSEVTGVTGDTKHYECTGECLKDAHRDEVTVEVAAADPVKYYRCVADCPEDHF